VGKTTKGTNEPRSR